MKNFIKIKLVGGSSYIQPKEHIADAIDAELDGVGAGQSI